MVTARPLTALYWIAKIGSALWAAFILVWVFVTGAWGLGGGVTVAFCSAVLFAAGIDVATVLYRNHRLEADRRTMAAHLRGGK